MKYSRRILSTLLPVALLTLQSFGRWDTEKFYGYTPQAKEILELVRVFLGMTKRGQIEQAPWIPSEETEI